MDYVGEHRWIVACSGGFESGTKFPPVACLSTQ